MNRTVAKASCFYLLGVVMAWYIHLSPFLYLMISFTAFCISGIRFATQRSIHLSLIACFIFLGAFRMGIEVRDPGYLTSFIGQGQFNIAGVVSSDPKSNDFASSFYLSVDTVSTPLIQVSGQEESYVYLNQPPYPSIGDRVVLAGEIIQPRDRDNFGGFSPKNYFKAKGIHALVQAREMIVEDEDRSKKSFFKVGARFKKTVADVLTTYLPEEEAGLARCLLIGDRGGLDNQIKAFFQRAGLSHVLAVSGLHVGVLSVAIYNLMHRLKMPPVATGALAMIVILVYCLWIGSLSALRAGIMFSFWVGAKLVHRTQDSATALLGAALIILLLWPGALFEVGYQLSFGATLGIAALYRRLNERYKATGSLFKEGFCLTLAAGIGSFPLVAYHFYYLPLSGILANFIAVPLTSAAVVLGWVAFIVQSIVPFTQGIAFVPVIPIMFALKETAQIFADLPINIPLAQPPLYGVVGYYCILVCFVVSPHWLFNYWGRYKKKILIALILLVIVTGCLGMQKSYRQLTASFINIGDADSCLVQLPGGKNLLVDIGAKGVFREGRIDIDSQPIMDFLRYKGIKKIDYLVLTHPHLDHYGGVYELWEQFPVEHIFISPDCAWQEILEGNRSQIHRVWEGGMVNFSPAVQGYFLHPPRELMANTGCDINNNSLVFRLVYHQFSILFTGDVEIEAEQLLVDKELKSTVLKVAHHGSPTSTSEPFVAITDPQYAVISSGNKHNRYNQVQKRLQQAGIQTYGTDEYGTVQFTTDGQKVKIRTAKRQKQHIYAGQ